MTARFQVAAHAAWKKGLRLAASRTATPICRSPSTANGTATKIASALAISPAAFKSRSASSSV